MPTKPLQLTDAERAALSHIVRSPSSEQRAVMRCRIVLMTADGVPTGKSSPNSM